MAPFTFALLAILTASLASAGPVALDNATLLLNGQDALVLNCQFQSLQPTDSCNTGDAACIQGESATCANGTWQTQPCPTSKLCLALPSVRTNGTFLACTSPNNAASIIAATGIQLDLANNCTSLGNTTFPLQGSPALSSVTTTPVTIQPTLTLPPTTTTLSPQQASSLISFLSTNIPSLVPNPNGSVANSSGNTSGAPPVIPLTQAPPRSSSPVLKLTPTASSSAITNGGYSY